jgi:Fe-S-cluster formation regulator IscX/YfhJ
MYRLLLLIGLCVFSMGCGSSTPIKQAEHDLPAHRPVDLATYAESYSQRFVAWQQAQQFSSQDPRFIEFHDLLRWLPEIAAESDLPEQEWNKLAEQSASLEQAWLELGRTGQRQSFPETGLKQLNEQLADIIKNNRWLSNMEIEERANQKQAALEDPETTPVENP